MENISRVRVGSQRMLVVGIDQGLYAIGNFALIAGIARGGRLGDVGVFAIQYAVLSVAVAGWRAGRLDLMLRDGSAGGWRRLGGLSLVMGIFAGAIGALLSLLVAGEIISLMIPAGAALLVTDAVRYRHLSGVVSRAVVLDALWMTATAAVAVMQAPVQVVVAVWAVSGLLAAVVTWQPASDGSGAGPAPGNSGIRMKTPTKWWAADQVAAAGSGLLAWAMIAGAIGPAALGSLRLVQAIFSPLGALYTAFPAMLIPYWKGLSEIHLVRQLRLLGAGLFSVVVIGTAVMSQGALDGVLNTVLGPSWSTVPAAVIIWVGMGRAGAGAAFLSLAASRVLGQGRSLFARRAVPGLVALLATAIVLAVRPDLVWAVATMSVGQIVAGGASMLDAGRGRS